MIWSIYVGKSEVKLCVMLDTGATVEKSYLLIALNRKLKQKKRLLHILEQNQRSHLLYRIIYCR